MVRGAVGLQGCDSGFGLASIGRCLLGCKHHAVVEVEPVVAGHKWVERELFQLDRLLDSGLKGAYHEIKSAP